MRRYLYPLWWRLSRPVFFPRAAAALDRVKGAPDHDEFLTRLWAYDGPDVYADIAPMQIPGELRELMQLVEQRQPKRLLEVGTATGGTLFALARVCPHDAVLVSLDLPGRQFGGGYPAPREALYRRFAFGRQRVELLRGDSHTEELRDRAAALVPGGKFDVIFIDGDHRYEGVSRDFDLYSPLLVEGGLLAFHDINENTTFGVPRLWQELTSGQRGLAGSPTEIVHRPDRPGYGIGVFVRAGG